MVFIRHMPHAKISPEQKENKNNPTAALRVFSLFVCVFELVLLPPKVMLESGITRSLDVCFLAFLFYRATAKNT